MKSILRFSALAGAALLVTACGGGDTGAVNEAEVNAVDANILFEEPANDASAMEAVGNAAEPAALPADTGAANTTTDAGATTGETSGGDTGGNTVDSNVAGM